MKQQQTRTRDAGFSLIEVLIAVVVLAFGLLALAALQTRLIQASSDSKAQSTALALAKDKLEEMRSYSNLVGYTALNTGSDPANAAALTDASGSLGGVNFTRSWTVKRFAPATGSTTFTQLPAGNVTGNLPAGYIKNNEFKTVDVRVAWTDATGKARAVALEDAIAGLDPQDTARNLNNRDSRSRGPRVVIYDPSTETGVIPIAIGDNSSTAATNPKPVNVARTGDDAVESRFDVLTYSALSGGVATAQSKVETTVVGCTCTNATTTKDAYRPTYWNGYRYVPPQLASYKAPAIAKSGVTQSRYCTACCSSHHDPSGIGDPKFSPRRSAHGHYSGIVSGTWQAATGTGDYLEACRLIRVDGIFDVASDMSDDYSNLLATAESGDDPAPSTVNPDAVTNYKNFVFNYLTARYVTQNPVPASASATFNNRTIPSPQTSATASDLDNPAEMSIAASAGLKWLHLRGLYIDYLEQPALDAVADAKSNCVGSSGTPTATELRNCVLRVLPFTSINLTEIADWTPLAGGPEIKVTNDDFDTSINFTDPIRGKVQSGTSPTPNQVTDAVSRVGSSNSGIAIFGDINPDEDEAITTDVNGFWRDTQPFRITGSGGSPGGTFNFGTANYTINVSNPRSLGFTYGTTDIVCGVSGTLNPVVCATQTGQTLPAAVTVRVGNYNASSTKDVVNPCQTNKTAPMPYLKLFDVTSITTSGAGTVGALSVLNPDVVGGIPTGEYTEAQVSSVGQGDTITATMSAPVYKCPLQIANDPSGYTCGGPGNNTVTWSTNKAGYTAAACSGLVP